MTMGSVFICVGCERFKPWDTDHPKSFCEAFPDGIPDDIIYGGFDHRQPHDGDHGVRFLLGADGHKALQSFEAAQKADV